MKNFTQLFKTGLVCAAGFGSLTATANTYTAVASGNFNSSATWAGGMAPGNNVNGDIISIPSGITVNLTQDETFSGVLTILNVDGSLTSNTNTALVLNTGNITGGGSINVDSMAMGFTSGFLYTGSITAQRMSSTGATIATSATITVTNSLYLTSGILSMLSGNLSLNSNATIIVSGGSMTTNGGTANLTNTYNVRYTGNTDIMSGLELSGSGLSGIEVATNSVMLSSDMNVNGMLTLTSGMLKLNNRNLTFGSNGDFSATGTGSIYSTNGSDLMLSSNNSFNGGLRFATGGNTVNNLMVNMGNASSTARLAGSLNVNGMLTLQSGRLDIDTNQLALMNATTITGGSNNSYVVTRGNGRLGMNLAAGSSAMYHVGTTSHYAPAMLTANNGNNSGMLSVGVNDSVRANGTTGSALSYSDKMVNSTWHVTSATTTNINLNLKVMWSSAMEVNGFNRNNAYVSHYTNGNWDTYTSASATAEANSMYSMSRDGITSLSPFAVYDANPTAIPTVVNNGAVSVYPNPANGTLYFTAPNQKVTNVAIYSAAGQLIKTVALSGNAIAVNDLAAGVYYASFSGTETVSVQKFVKQ